MTTSNPVDLTPDFAEQTAEHDQTQAAIAAESANVQTHVTAKTTEVVTAVGTESGNVQTHVTAKAAEVVTAVSVESGNVQGHMTAKTTEVLTAVSNESATIQSKIDAIPSTTTIRGVTNLGMGISYQAVTIPAIADLSKARLRLLGYRNATYKDFRAWIALDNATTIGIRCDYTNTQVNTMTVSWELDIDA